MPAADWDNFVPPDDNDVMTGAASDTNFGHMFGYSKSSFIYVFAADEAAPSIRKDLQYGSRLPEATNAWAVMPCDPYADAAGHRFDPLALLEVQLLMADEEDKLIAAGRVLGSRTRMQDVEIPASGSRFSGLLMMC